MIQAPVISAPGVEDRLGNSLRIATYNIQNLTDGKNDGWRRTSLVTRRQIVNAARIISQLDAEVLVLQEIENLDVLERLNRTLEVPYAHLCISQFSSSPRDKKLNIAVASRLPLLDVAELDFAAVNRFPVKLSRGAVRFILELEKDRRLLGYGIHLKSNFGDPEQNVMKRKFSTQVIRDDADSIRAGNPEITFEVLVLGDANVDPDLPRWAGDPSLSAFKDWADLFRGVPLEKRTTVARRLGDPEMAYDPVCFDRMIVSPELTQKPWKINPPVVLPTGVDIQNIYVSPGQNDVHVSDHYPVYADMEK